MSTDKNEEQKDKTPKENTLNETTAKESTEMKDKTTGKHKGKDKGKAKTQEKSAEEQTNLTEGSDETGSKSETEAEVITEEEKKDLQLAELSEKFMRLAAEYDNFRRRSQKEKDGIYSDCISTVVSAWLPIIDNLERASFVSENYESKEAKKIADGVELILSQVKEVLTGLGVTEVQALSKKFDPNMMDAVMHEENENVGESEVIEVFTKGYIKGDKVIRHAMVKVAN